MSVLWEEILQPGASWSHVLKRGTRLRLTDIEGGANMGAIFYNFEMPSERYNMPDTLKAQHIARLTAGNVLYSDMGRVLCSIVEDSVGWHDPIGGVLNSSGSVRKYGPSSYQESRNDYVKNGRDSFLVELGKYGLDGRDLIANVNFFSKVVVDEWGAMTFVEGHSKPGAFVELRSEMNVLTILNTCPHPMDPAAVYAPKPVQLTILSGGPVASDDACRVSRPENERGFVLTERYFL